MSSGGTGNTGSLSYSNLETEVSMERLANEVPEDPPFHMLILGKFAGISGNENLGPIRQIDRDDFADVLKKIAPRLEVSLGDESVLNIQFASLDDFHPDSLFKRLRVFDDLRELRKRLQSGDSFADAAREVRGWFDDGFRKVKAEEEREVVENIEVGDEAGLLDDILGSKTRDAVAYKSKEDSVLGDFARQLMDPHLVRVDESEQAGLLNAVDELASDLMRGIVQDKGFKELEALWRGVYLVCRKVETSNALKIFVLDIGKDEFQKGLKEDDKNLSEVLHGKFDAGSAREPWALIAGAFDFGLNVDDVSALIRMSGISASVSSPFVSHIRPAMLGFDSFVNANGELNEIDTKTDTREAKLWTALRASDDSAALGLVVPRLLGRLPYGEDTDPAETFDFEEFGEDSGHVDYLWMNPVFGFCVVLASSFSRYGWEMGGRYELDLEGLPMHYLPDRGTKPCAEFEMTDSIMEVLLAEGLMAFGAFRGTDRARLGGMQSVKFPQKALAGRWS